MSKPQLELEVLIAGLMSKKDGSIKITLETRELPATTAAQLFGYRNREAWCVIAPSEAKEVVIPDEKPDPALGSKTPAQRLRNVLYVFWEQRGSKGNFDDFYKTQMEKLIEQVKEKLE